MPPSRTAPGVVTTGMARCVLSIVILAVLAAGCGDADQPASATLPTEPTSRTVSPSTIAESTTTALLTTTTQPRATDLPTTLAEPTLPIDPCLARPLRDGDLTPTRAADLAAGSAGFAFSTRRWDRFRACFAMEDVLIDTLPCYPPTVDGCGVPALGYELSTLVMPNADGTATVGLRLNNGFALTDVLVTTAVVNGAPRIVSLRPAPVDMSGDVAIATLNEYFAAVTAGDWSTAASLLARDPTPVDQRQDLVPLFTPEITAKLGPDADLARRLQAWCAVETVVCGGALRMSYTPRISGGQAIVHLATFGAARVEVVRVGDQIAVHLPELVTTSNSPSFLPIDPAALPG